MRILGRIETALISQNFILCNIIAAIISRGSADGYSTESPERLHIDFAKSAYWASNKKNYIKQMTKWLSHQEACNRFAITSNGQSLAT